MFYRNKKTRKYQTPSVKVTQMSLESNFCQTVRVSAQVDELHDINTETGDAAEQMYFEF